MSFFVKKYRNVYTKYANFPYHKLTGKDVLLYTGDVIVGINGIPDGYDEKLDYYFSCDCDYPKWREIRKT